MIAINTINAIPSYEQDYNPSIIPISSKIENNNYNTLLEPNTNYFNENYIYTPVIALIQNEPNFNSDIDLNGQIYQFNYNYAHSSNHIENLEKEELIKNQYNGLDIREASSINTIEYPVLIYNNVYNNLEYNNINQYNNDNPMIEPEFNLKLEEFVIINQIGKGSEGEIYTVRWNKNNKNYAMKKCEIQSFENLNARKEEIITLLNYIISNSSDGVLITFGCQYVPNNAGFFDFYEIMELAERDWEQEIGIRQKRQLFYNENELMEILKRLVRTFSSLQSNHITHRDVKPQNLMFVNGILKICDFGDAKILKKKGIIVQRIRGSELFMSPIVFRGYHSGMAQIKHNTFKSDVFSLGMCIFFAACLSYDGPSAIREIYDMNVIYNILHQYLGRRYSKNFIDILWIMLQVDENLRPDFKQLQKMFNL